jgi:hypothetical protein
LARTFDWIRVLLSTINSDGSASSCEFTETHTDRILPHSYNIFNSSSSPCVTSIRTRILLSFQINFIVKTVREAIYRLPSQITVSEGFDNIYGSVAFFVEHEDNKNMTLRFFIVYNFFFNACFLRFSFKKC